MDVAMTVEPHSTGYAQHMVTVERGNGDSVQCMVLTDGEMAQLGCMLENYRTAEGHVSVRFADPTGRPAVIHEEHGTYGVVS